MTKILIKNSTIVNANKTLKSDILISNGKIEKIEKCINNTDESTLIIDATNKFILPGGIDPHVHLHLKTGAGYSADNFYTGTKAALAGGTTTVIDFVTPDNRKESLLLALQKRKKEAENSICNYAFHISPLRWNKQVAIEMEKCVKEEGITSFKTYMAYKNVIGVENNILHKLMQKIAELKGLMMIHAEMGDEIDRLQKQCITDGKTEPKYHAETRPVRVEEEAVRQIIKICRETKCKTYIVHVSSGKTVELIKNAQKEGIPIYAETCPQYLIFDKSALDKPFYEAAPFVFSPALHEKEHRELLWQGIQQGIITSIGTDHCPFNLYGQKDVGLNDFTKIPNGTGGIEHRMELLYTFGVLQNRISLEQMVNICSTTPANIFGIANKGKIEIGYDADLVIWNPDTGKTISVENQIQNSDNNIYSGIEIKGEAESVIMNGEVVYSKKNGFTDVKGEFITRNSITQ